MAESHPSSAYYPSRWPAEDGGPRRNQVPHSGAGLGIRAGERLTAHFRFDPAATMVVHRDEGELFLQRHTLGPDSVGMVERIDPITLETITSSGELPAGPTWPGGIAVAADGFILQTYGRWAHRLDPHSLEVVAARELPRNRPYNSFVLLDDGTMVTKDFGKDSEEPTGIVALDPVTLEPRTDEFVLPERSIARLSADGDTLYVVGTEHIFRLHWAGGWTLDTAFDGLYRTIEGQTYGWDAVIASGAAWFLDDGEGTEGFMAKGSFRTNGASPAPLHLVRADLRDGSVTLHEICGAPMGIVANPPVVDESRSIAVGFDSANATMTAFDIREDGSTSIRWQREQGHGPHMVLYPDTGELVTHDHDLERMMEQVVVVDIETGAERGRVDTGSPLMAPVFPAPGFGRDLYSCAFPGITRIAVEPED
ncbi:MAG: hypothetical protein ACKO2C_01825 [Actinomycetes bacterium]